MPAADALRFRLSPFLRVAQSPCSYNIFSKVDTVDLTAKRTTAFLDCKLSHHVVDGSDDLAALSTNHYLLADAIVVAGVIGPALSHPRR